MKHDFPIPPIMQDLKKDPRGYPIPFFTPIVDGKPDFRYQDPKKYNLCIDKRLCSICGKKLYDKSYWFITGPIGLSNRCASDSAMHEDCARFSIAVCPHLIFHKAERRSDEDLATTPGGIRAKPYLYILVKADKFERHPADHKLIYYRPVYHERYVYDNNKLVRE